MKLHAACILGAIILAVTVLITGCESSPHSGGPFSPPPEVKPTDSPTTQPNLITRAYDITDLLIDTLYDGRNEAPPTAQHGLFGDDTRGSISRRERITQLISLIQETVDADSWRENARERGTIRELGGRLVITQSAANQYQIANLMEQLRETRAIMHTVDVKFLTIEPDTVMKLPPALRKAMEKANRPLGENEEPVLLTESEATELLKLTATDPGTASLSIPRMALFDRQRGSTLIPAQTPYVKSYSPVVGVDGITRYEPNMGSIDSGILMQFEGTVSADRRQFSAEIGITLTRLRGFIRAGGPAPDGSDLGIQKPYVNKKEFRKTLKIPDRGILLLGAIDGPAPGVRAPAAATHPSTAPLVPILERLLDDRGGRRFYVLLRPAIILGGGAMPKIW